MSSSYSYYLTVPANSAPGPLTTIFTPPTNCFKSYPDFWSTCNTGFDTTSVGNNCYWSQPESCYPSAAVSVVWVGQSFTYPADLFYSPGVLPSGFSPVSSLIASDTTTVNGCLSGWSASGAVWCSKVASGTFYVVGFTETGNFAAVLPQIVVTWDASDLSSFRPSSAPILGTSTTSKTTSTAPATRSKPSVATSTAGPSQGPIGTQSAASGLSTGAKAGIGVGAAVIVLAAIVIAFFFFRLRRHRAREDQSQRPGYVANERPYVDSKAELSGRENWKKHGARNVELQELDPQRHPQELAAR